MADNNRIIQPGKVQVMIQHAPGPLVEPQAITVQGGGVIIVGGLSKLEHVATELAKSSVRWNGKLWDGKSDEHSLVDCASKILEACKDAQKNDEAKPDDPEA
ncbi:hypothetical protein [uncultured Mediterranean phage uvDeep-CGR2-KM19-C37]|nr:hypothetical protein [uncultured Mediterranean phage uvDeep-CGR2-KM19-C37]